MNADLTNLGVAGATYDFTLAGTATFVAAPALGGADSVSFPDGSAYIQVGGGGFPLGSSWAASAWFRNLKPSTSYRTLFRGSSLHHPLLIDINTNTVGTWDNSGSGVFVSFGYDIGAIANDNNWHFLAVVGTSGSTLLYVDGVLQGTAPFQSTTDILAIGNFQGGTQAFADNLDEIYIYNRALNAAEINLLFLAGNPLCL